jgi:hypothetical protein
MVFIFFQFLCNILLSKKTKTVVKVCSAVKKSATQGSKIAFSFLLIGWLWNYFLLLFVFFFLRELPEKTLLSENLLYLMVVLKQFWLITKIYLHKQLGDLLDDRYFEYMPILWFTQTADLFLKNVFSCARSWFTQVVQNCAQAMVCQDCPDRIAIHKQFFRQTHCFTYIVLPP